jgi:hypothetical protein
MRWMLAANSAFTVKWLKRHSNLHPQIATFNRI